MTNTARQVDAASAAMASLVAQGADVVASNREGQTALSLAQEKNHREAAALLRKHGA